ncbi:hypothetical protein EDD15DRAFT_2266849, partial [Pisolithus albus]
MVLKYSQRSALPPKGLIRRQVLSPRTLSCGHSCHPSSSDWHSFWVSLFEFAIHWPFQRFRFFCILAVLVIVCKQTRPMSTCLIIWAWMTDATHNHNPPLCPSYIHTWVQAVIAGNPTSHSHLQASTFSYHAHSSSMSATSGGLGTITNPVFSVLESDSNLSKSRSEQQFADPVFIPCI